MKIIVNIGGTSIKCKVYSGNKLSHDIRILGFGLNELYVYEGSNKLSYEGSNPIDAIEFAAKKIAGLSPELSIEAIFYRIKYFRPSPTSFELTDVAIDELRIHDYLQYSHYQYLYPTITIFKKLLPDTLQIALPDHAGLVGTGVMESSKLVPREYLSKYGLFAIPQHGYAIRSVISHPSNQSTKRQNNTLICHIGSGITVSFIKDGYLAWNSMLYSSCDGPLMTYRTGNLPTGMFLRMINSGSKTYSKDIFTDCGIYSCIPTDSSHIPPLTDLIDINTYRESSDIYINKITTLICEALVTNGYPDNIIFAGNMLVKSDSLFTRIIEKLSKVTNKKFINTASVSELENNAESLKYSFQSVDEEIVMASVADSTLKNNFYQSGSIVKLENKNELISHIKINYPDIPFDPDENFSTFHISNTDSKNSFEIQAPTPSTYAFKKTVYIDNINHFIHEFPYQNSAELKRG